MMRHHVCRLAVLLMLLGCMSAHAAIVWDYGPSMGTWGGGPWSNQTAGQNYAEAISFSEDTYITGFNYFTDFTSLDGTSFHIKFLYDSGAFSPGSYLTQFNLNYSDFGLDGSYGGHNIYKATLTFGSPVLLSAGPTYWVGASGNGFEAAQASVHLYLGGSGTMARFNGLNYEQSVELGDQMFQLDGYSANAVPVPGAFLLAGIGAGLVGWLRRRVR